MKKNNKNLVKDISKYEYKILENINKLEEENSKLRKEVIAKEIVLKELYMKLKEIY